jgi:hypothetical protein
MAKVRFGYPRSDTPRYSPMQEEVATEFAQKLWRPGELGDIVHPAFEERRYPDGEVTIRGLPALQRYRLGLGVLELVSLELLAVPPDMTMAVPGGKGERYDIDVFFEAVFLMDVTAKNEDGSPKLPPGSPTFPGGTPPALLVIRMREPQKHKLFTLPNGQRKLMVIERTWDAYGEVGPLPPGGQHDFVARQLYFLRRRMEEGRPESMHDAGVMRPFRLVVRDAIPDAF